MNRDKRRKKPYGGKVRNHQPDSRQCFFEASAEGREAPLVSIIVPVYQVREYIGECVESLRQQTYTNLEIILVDDGSTDGSGEICDKYALVDSRIRVIHQKNKGLSGARNAGLDHYRGAYVAFVDSDDLVLPEYIESLYALLVKYGADIAACAYVKGSIGKLLDFKDKAAVSGDAAEEICMPSGELLRQWHGKYKQLETTAWNKLYSRNVWNGREQMRFPEGRLHEDILTSHSVVQSVAKVALTTRKLYLYRVREGSIVTHADDSREGIRQNLLAQRERMAFFRKHGYWRAYGNLMAGYLLHAAWFGWKLIRRHLLISFSAPAAR